MTAIRRPGDTNNKSFFHHRRNTIRTLICRIFIILVITVVILLYIYPDDNNNNNTNNAINTNTSNNKFVERTKKQVAYMHNKIKNVTKLMNNILIKNKNYNNVRGTLQHIQTVIDHKRHEIQEKLQTLHDGKIPMRLRILRNKHEIIGERMKEVTSGINTIQEIIHGHDLLDYDHIYDHKLPMLLKDIIYFINQFIYTLHEILKDKKHANHIEIWESYHDLTIKTLYPWDREYLNRMPIRRTNDDSIFVSIVSYRDEYCLSTLLSLYHYAKHPENVYVGLVQQNCYGTNCKSGLLENLTYTNTLPDSDCYKFFCQSSIGKPICYPNSNKNNNKKHKNTRTNEIIPRIRVINMNESDALGPYTARYFASKLWYGEQWYMQIDSHMKFIPNWDTISIDMLKKAPSTKPIISHYPPDHNVTITSNKTASRLCGPAFTTSDLEEQIIRIEGSSYYEKHEQLSIPAFSPFVGAGFLIGHSDMLRDVPYDPFLPWIFMGEEIILSSRLWTSGYDMFSPTQSIVKHYYHRKHTPKFWESLHRTFTFGIHNPLQGLILQRIKYLLNYPESNKDMLPVKSILSAIEQYGMGIERSLNDYLYIIGTNMNTKTLTYMEWCEKGYPPPGFEKYNHLYPGIKDKTMNFSNYYVMRNNMNENNNNNNSSSSQNKLTTRTPTSTAT